MLIMKPTELSGLRLVSSNEELKPEANGKGDKSVMENLSS